MKYTVSVAIDARIDVEVEANSFEEARQTAEKGDATICGNLEVSFNSVTAICAEREDGEFKGY